MSYRLGTGSDAVYPPGMAECSCGVSVPTGSECDHSRPLYVACFASGARLFVRREVIDGGDPLVYLVPLDAVNVAEESADDLAVLQFTRRGGR